MANQWTKDLVPLEKGPRKYAHEIMQIKDLEGRRSELAKVPERLQEIVKTHIRIAWERNKNKIFRR